MHYLPEPINTNFDFKTWTLLLLQLSCEYHNSLKPYISELSSHVSSSAVYDRDGYVKIYNKTIHKHEYKPTLQLFNVRIVQV